MTPIPYSIFWKAFTLLTGSKVQASEAILGRLDNCQWSAPIDQLAMVDVPDDMADLVRALGGPHGETMLKAYVIRVEHEQAGSGVRKTDGTGLSKLG